MDISFAFAWFTPWIDILRKIRLKAIYLILYWKEQFKKLKKTNFLEVELDA